MMSGAISHKHIWNLLDPCLPPPILHPQPPEDEYARPVPKGLPKAPLTLYQYEVCPFCCKAKAALDFYKARVGTPMGGHQQAVSCFLK